MATAISASAAGAATGVAAALDAAGAAACATGLLFSNFLTTFDTPLVVKTKIVRNTKTIDLC